MTRQQALDLLSRHKGEMSERFGVSELALFGSLARDEAGAGSDVDVLVEFQEPATFDHYIGLLDFLESLLHTRVDLATPTMIRPRMRPMLDKDLIRVA